MPSFISEDDIEQAMRQKRQHLYGYEVLECGTADREDLNDGSGRASKREVAGLIRNGVRRRCASLLVETWCHSSR